MLMLNVRSNRVLLGVDVITHGALFMAESVNIHLVGSWRI